MDAQITIIGAGVIGLGAGIRPKIQKPGDPLRDFYISEESKKGLPGFVNLIGMESPGLTASIAIAKYVNNLISTVI